MRSTVILAGLILVVALAATWAPVSAHRRITTTVTWDREISAIFAARCVRCHQPGGRAPMPLTTYAEARPWARAIRHEVVTRRMPVWHAARGYGEFANDPSLSPHEIALIAAWVDGGAPQTFVPFGTLQMRPKPSAPVQAAREPAPPASRDVRVTCGRVSLPEGTLLGIRPILESGRDVRVVMESPEGTQSILAWIRRHDPEAGITYWLRTPSRITRGSFLIASGAAGCSMVLLYQP